MGKVSLDFRRLCGIALFLLAMISPGSAWSQVDMEPVSAEQSLAPLQAPQSPEQPLSPLHAQTTLPTTPPASEILDSYFATQGKKVFRWNDKTKYVMIYIADGTGLPGWNPENIQRVQAALAEWERAMYPRFRLLCMPDTRGTDVVISWKPFVERDQKGDQAGRNITVTWGKYLQRNDIELMLNDTEGRPLSPSAIQSIALHEIGHMLGIKGHSDRREDVMFPSAPYSIYSEPQHLTARDVNTLKMIYQQKPNYTNPEKVPLTSFENFKKTHRGGGMSIMWVMIGFVPVPIPMPF